MLSRTGENGASSAHGRQRPPLRERPLCRTDPPVAPVHQSIGAEGLRDRRHAAQLSISAFAVITDALQVPFRQTSAALSDRHILRKCQDTSGEVSAVDALDQCCSSELVTGKSDLKQASLCEGLGGQEMREAEGRS
jgi:hypothetical protein